MHGTLQSTRCTLHVARCTLYWDTLYVHVTHLTPLASHLTQRTPQLSGAGVHWLAKAVKEGEVGFEAIIIDEAGQVRCDTFMVPSNILF